MPRAMNKAVLGVCALLAAGAAERAQALVGLTHVGSLYADDKARPLKGPEGVACGRAGSLVVADTANGRLVTFAEKDGNVTPGPEVRVSQLAAPVRVEYDSKGNILALDAKSRRIARVNANGIFTGFVEFKGAAAPASVMAGAFKVDEADSVYVLDLASHAVIVVDANGTVTRQVPLPAGRTAFTDVAVDAAGTIFAVDAIPAVVWSVEKGGTAFKPITKSLKDDMSFPAYMTASKGRLYLVDRNGNGVVVLGQDGSFQGRQLSIGWTDGLVNYPSQLCLREDEAEVFVADRFNNRVQLFRLSK